MPRTCILTASGKEPVSSPSSFAMDADSLEHSGSVHDCILASIPYLLTIEAAHDGHHVMPLLKCLRQWHLLAFFPHY